MDSTVVEQFNVRFRGELRWRKLGDNIARWVVKMGFYRERIWILMDSVYFIRTPLAWRLKGKEYFLEQPCDVALDARGGRGLKGRVVVGFSRHGRLLISRRIRNGALYKLARQPVADIDSFFQPRPVFLFLFSLLSLLCNINRAIPSSFLEFSSLYIYIVTFVFSDLR